MKCPAGRARDRPFAIQEQNAGRFVPRTILSQQPDASMQDSMCMRCWVLPDACLEIRPAPEATKVYNDPRSNSLGVKLYRKDARPFKIHVGGLTPDALRARLERLGSYVKDPLFTQILRHLEMDVVWANRTAGNGPWASFPQGGGGNNSPRGSNSTSAVRGGRDANNANNAINANNTNDVGEGAPAGGDDELTMVWPYWEKGYGDVIANTLLPLGELLRMGAFPRHLALSGMRHQTLLPPLAACAHSLCASERANPPLLPRCSSACWRRIRICQPEFFESTRDTWRATVALDAAASQLGTVPRGGGGGGGGGGVRAARNDPDAAVAAAYAAAKASETDLRSFWLGAGSSASGASSTSALSPLTRVARWALGARGGAFASGFAGGSEMRVLIAARHGRRLLANALELTRACNGTVIPGLAAANGGVGGGGEAGSGGGTTLRCELLPADAPQPVKIARLRASHAYVCVWGGDTVHALHMRRGSAVIELRSAGFASGAPWSWLELHRRWVTRFTPPGGGGDGWGGGAGAPHSREEKEWVRPLRFTPVLLPPAASIFGKDERQCLERNHARQQRWQQQQATAERKLALAAKKASTPPPAPSQPKRRMPNETWLCYWNADLNVRMSDLLPALRGYAHSAARERGVLLARAGRGAGRGTGRGAGGRGKPKPSRAVARARGQPDE